MTSFKTKEDKIFWDAKWLQPLSDPPDGLPLCRDSDLELMASFVQDVFRTGQGRNLFIVTLEKDEILSDSRGQGSFQR
jgi:hypothetical protein